MTEEDAKTKWCPYATNNRPPDSFNLPGAYRTSHEETRCIASACMAWRWMEGPNALRYDNEAGTSHRIEPSERRGFCGIAGMPSE